MSARLFEQYEDGADLSIAELKQLRDWIDKQAPKVDEQQRSRMRIARGFVVAEILIAKESKA